MDPTREAAILVSALDMEAADALLEQMPDEFAAAVRNQVMELDSVDPLEESAIIEKFLGREPRATEVADTLELSEAAQETVPLAEYLTQSSDALDESLPDHHTKHTPFGFLQDADEHSLVSVLQREHPQTIALVMAHIEAPLAAKVLASLEEEIQVDVTRRMIHLEHVEPQTLWEIEEGLRSLFSKTATGTRAGYDALKNIAAELSPSESGLLKNLKEADAKLAVHLTPAIDTPETASNRIAKQATVPHSTFPPIDFHDLVKLSDADLGKVLQRADGRVLLLALAGADTVFINQIYRQLPREDARTLRRQIEQQGTIRLRDVEEAQRRIGKVAGQLAVEGALDVPPTRRLAVAA